MKGWRDKMAKLKYNYEYYLGQSEKLKNFLDDYKTQNSTYRAYRLHLVRYFQHMDIKDVDSYIKDTRMMDKKEKITYLDGIEKDLKNYWMYLNDNSNGKTPYIWLSAIKMFLINNKTFELDDVYIKMQKNGHGNYSVTNTDTPTREELLKIFSYSNPESKAIFMFQLTSGQRIGKVIETTFNNIEIDHDCPRIFYPHSKQKFRVKTRITPEAKKILQEYLEQREKFIKIREKRGGFHRQKELDENKLFPMNIATANIMWNTMVKNAGLYKLDPNTNKPVFGTHCLRRYFLTHFGDKEFGDFFSGHITPRNKEYRQYSHEKLDEIYKKHIDELNIFETPVDLSGLHDRLDKKDKTIEDMQMQINDLQGKYGDLLHKIVIKGK